MPKLSGAAVGLHVEVVEDAQRLASLAPAWDELAGAVGRPAALGGWQLAWWRRFAPPGARLRVVVVRDADRLVAVAPFALQPASPGRWEARLLASQITQRVEPLARPQDVGIVAPLIARALAAALPGPATVHLDAVGADGRWLEALTAAWPGRRRPWTLTDERRPAPVANLGHDSFDAWLKCRSSNFRQQARRFRRRLLQAGGAIRMTQHEAELERDVAAFAALHHARWDERGGSSLPREIGAMLCDAGRALLPDQRLRLWIVELDQRVIGAQLFLAAGGTVQYWNGGFDVDAAHAKPALVGMVAAIEDCISRGERVLDLGGGAHDYKLRIADDDRPLASSAIVPRDRGYLLNRAALGRRTLEQVARERASARQVRLLRTLRGRR